MPDDLYRDPYDAWIAGVCAGIARRFGWSRGAVRAAFVVSTLLPGPQVLIYAALWVLMPKRRT